MQNDHLDNLEDVVEDMVERSINNALARHAMPQVTFVDPGSNLFIETVVTNNYIWSHIRSHLSHIDEHYYIPCFCNGHYGAFQEFVLSNKFQHRLPTNNEMVGFLFEEIPLLDPSRHPFFMVWRILFGIALILSMVTIKFAGTIVLVQEVYGHNHVDPQDRHQFHELIPLNCGYCSDQHQCSSRMPDKAGITIEEMETVTILLVVGVLVLVVQTMEKVGLLETRMMEVVGVLVQIMEGANKVGVPIIGDKVCILETRIILVMKTITRTTRIVMRILLVTRRIVKIPLLYL